jgi:hypothetical protein
MATSSPGAVSCRFLNRLPPDRSAVADVAFLLRTGLLYMAEKTTPRPFPRPARDDLFGGVAHNFQLFDPPRATLPLTSAALSTRERERLRGLPSGGGATAGVALGARGAGLGDVSASGRRLLDRQRALVPKRRREFAKASKAPREQPSS